MVNELPDGVGPVMSERVFWELEQRLGRKLTSQERHLLELATDSFDGDPQQEQRPYHASRQYRQFEQAG